MLKSKLFSPSCGLFIFFQISTNYSPDLTHHSKNRFDVFFSVLLIIRDHEHGSVGWQFVNNFLRHLVELLFRIRLLLSIRILKCLD